MNLSHVISFMAGFVVMLIILWIYSKWWEKNRRKKPKVVEYIGPDLGKVRIAVEIHSYDIKKSGTYMNMALKDEYGSRSVFTCHVPEDLPKRMPPGDKYYFNLEEEKDKKS